MGAACILGLLAVLLACLPEASGGSFGRTSFTLRVQSRDRDWGRAADRRALLLRNTTFPLHGAVKEYGYFYVNIYIGSPPTRFAVIVDTGSTMTYVPCSSCGGSCGSNHQDAAFNPSNSSTATVIACSSPQCQCGSPTCGCSAGQCTYQRTYAEQSSSSGLLVQDLLLMEDGGAGAPVIFGCETQETGEIYKQQADGLLGLGNSAASVVNQLVSAGTIDNMFSLCFGMVEGEGALLLGDAPLPANISLVYTPQVIKPSHPFYYNAKLQALAVDGNALAVDASLYDQGYGTVLDSGTTFTYIPTAAFQAFAAAVDQFARAQGLYRVPGPDPQYPDICYGGATTNYSDIAALSSVFPSLGVTFDGGASLTLGPLNYLFVHTVQPTNPGKYCLGFFDNGATGTLLGGITFRDVLVQYDRGNGRVGFAPAECKALGLDQRPPCSVFQAAGDSSGLTALQAAADDDCQPDVPRQQQQQEGSKVQDGGQSEWKPVDNSGVPTGSSSDEEGSSGQSTTPSVDFTEGVVVGVVAFAVVCLAVLLMQPAVRDRLRSLMPGSGDSSAFEPVGDSEGTRLMTVVTDSAAQVPALTSPMAIPLANLGPASGDEAAASTGRSPVRLTMPQKLQRSASSVAAEDGQAGPVARTGSGFGLQLAGASPGGLASPSPQRPPQVPRVPSPRPT